MCRSTTVRIFVATATLGMGFLSAPLLRAQVADLDWRHIGNSALELGLPSVGTGPVDRVWYSADGSTLYASTRSGRTYQSTDFEQWQRVLDSRIAPPAQTLAPASSSPEKGAKFSIQAGTSSRLYALGSYVYRSEDGGNSWSNLTAYKGTCILGSRLSDVAVSPRDPNQIVVASENGVWRSMDAGASWSGLNEFLPNLPAGHLEGVPTGTQGVRLRLSGTTVPGSNAEIEWAPGEKTAWKPLDGSDNSNAPRDRDLKAALSTVLNRSITAVAMTKNYIYAGDSEGWLEASYDGGVSWGTTFKLGELGNVESIWIDPNDPRVAVAALRAQTSGNTTQARPVYVLRTMNGGIFWDDITANLPETASARGVTADRASGAVYVATDAGVFYTTTDLGSASRPTVWSAIGATLPAVPASDVRLDSGANQLYVALDGYGVYVALAPHRLHDARVVNAADYSSRPAAPGTLLSVLGSRIQSAQSDNAAVPVLDATDRASQIQVPFEAQGDTVSLSLQAAAGPLTVGLPLQNVSPAIFVDPEGTPLIMDAEGILLDSTKPAQANTRIQVLATGLGRVQPGWPTGLAAPLKEPPSVVASVRGYLDGVEVQVISATLAPGYVGFYLVEIQLPRIVNAGAGALLIEAEGQPSNRVRLYLEP
jgi:uncharacterized protein (TIGR03437 family)